MNEHMPTSPPARVLPDAVTDLEHAHRFHRASEHAETKTMRVALLTLAMMVVEIVAGWIYGSMALMADGWHMSTHAGALGIAWAAFVLARRLADDRRFAFGTWKIEILGGFVSAILLGMVGLFMIGMSVERLVHPVPIRFDQAILVAVIGLVVNLVSVVLLESPGRAHHDHGPEQGGQAGHDPTHANLNLRAAYLHVVADALTSVLAIVALLGGKLAGWTWLDPCMGLVGAWLILRWTVYLLKETGSILLDRETDDAMARKIRLAVESVGHSQIIDLHVWKVGQGRYACIVSVVARRPHATAVYKARLAQLSELVHATVEIHLSDATVANGV